MYHDEDSTKWLIEGLVDDSEGKGLCAGVIVVTAATTTAAHHPAAFLQRALLFLFFLIVVLGPSTSGTTCGGGSIGKGGDGKDERSEILHVAFWYGFVFEDLVHIEERTEVVGVLQLLPLVFCSCFSGRFCVDSTLWIACTLTSTQNPQSGVEILVVVVVIVVVLQKFFRKFLYETCDDLVHIDEHT